MSTNYLFTAISLFIFLSAAAFWVSAGVYTWLLVAGKLQKQFTLRMLFIAVTIFGLTIGLYLNLERAIVANLVIRSLENQVRELQAKQ